MESLHTLWNRNRGLLVCRQSGRVATASLTSRDDVREKPIDCLEHVG